MCRGKDNCSELDLDPFNWDKHCPLSIPEWFDDEVTIFVKAIELFIKGNRNGCIELILSIRDSEMTDWYIEHGQMSGMHRKNILKIKREEPIPEELRDPLRSPTKYQNQVFIRDGYRCRYCGSRLISQMLLKAFIKQLNLAIIKRGKTNITTHGIIHATWPVADHLVPWVIGGRTNLENLVASCAPCNYGKAGYTIEQIGIDDPFKYPPKIDDWDGLESQIINVKSQKIV